MSEDISRTEPWHVLTQWTSARIAMGRVGSSLPTKAVMEFNADHALARDAVYASLDLAEMQEQFAQAGFTTLVARSRAQSRSEYLRRPDLGRSLDPVCAAELQLKNIEESGMLSVVVADGLSALAPRLHAAPLLKQLCEGLGHWKLDSVVLATQARVALGDEIGELRGAEAVLVLIGERPGLRSSDSLGAYLTYRPKVGRMDSERNCISNIRPVGLGYEQAAFRLKHLLERARILGATGVSLKDESDDLPALQ